VSSPTSTGPAGAHFEGKVGAHYLLSMLVEASPRGLPGTMIDRIELQRAAQGMHLDDVIVRAHDRSGKAAILEIQVKRTIPFSPKDEVFRSVVEQIAKTAANPDFWTSNHQLAIATSATSRKINGAYQDVLTWARQTGDAKTFMEQIERSGTSNEDMRAFVQTFRSHLHEAGVTRDDEAVWKLLARLHILIFDFTAQGSSAQELAQERCARALEPAEANRAGDLWKALTDIALEVAASAGDRDRNRLLEDLQKSSFKLAALPSNTHALRALAELSRGALEDIDDRVCGASLSRISYVSAVRAALEGHRYVEIRGEAGMGKSGLMRHFAEQIAEESPILVLTPERTPVGGWFELQSKLGYQGDCRDLLHDLARNGGATLFIDSLDFFPPAARLTVIDILRQAEGVPGISVIATARREFGEFEPSWLPQQPVATMEPANPVDIEELSKEETDELRQAAPRIAWLLTENHPARAVIRNLYRLSRLASLSPNDSVPLSEAEMASRWWSVADGEKDDTYLDRARLLRSLAKQAIGLASRLDTTGHPANAIRELISNETVSELGIDRVKFRHDVLREWAVANLLFSDPATVALLSLSDAPPPDLARAVELAARMKIERGDNSDGWLAFLEEFSASEANTVWRRSVLLSLARSELSRDLLTKAAGALFADKGALLKELIRVVMAVDSELASKHFVIKGPAKTKLPEGFHVPSGPSWLRLIRWSLAISEYLPAGALLDVANLFGAWCMAFIGQDPYTPLIVRQVHTWLRAIEQHEDPLHEVLRSQLDDTEWAALAAELRQTFLLFCNRVPELAVEYLESFYSRPHHERSMLELLKFRGTLAQAAPTEFADLTIEALIPKPRRSRYRESMPEGPFDFADYQFHPVSPAHGPFFDLLSAVPSEGLRLIRRLVDHAIGHFSNGAVPGEDVVTLHFPDGRRTFPWTMSYVWSREYSDGPGVVISALMALEIWAHRRIEAGEPVETVIRQVLAGTHTPAAYLLIAVDLLISHWPKSKETAIPFLGCPQLLSMDRNRIIFDRREDIPDPFNLKGIQKEPIGLVSVKELDLLPSRSLMFDQLLDAHDHFLEPVPNPALQRLRELLEEAAKSLGAPEQNSGLLDPRLMVIHALNRLEPDNWKLADFRLTDGSAVSQVAYFSPPEEAAHHARLEQESRQRRTDAEMTRILSRLLDLPERATPEFVIHAVEWAQHKAAEQATGDRDADWIKQEAINMAALIAARDGGREARNRFRGWLLETFQHALEAKDDTVHRVRDGLRYNPFAMAFLGMIHLLKDERSSDELRELLKVAGRMNPAAAHGMAAGAVELSEIDERFPRAVVRTAFKAMTRPDRNWNTEEQEYLDRLEAQQEEVLAHIEEEIGWLESRGPEPAWPSFIPKAPYVCFRHRNRPGRPEIEEHATSHTDPQGAGLWLKSIEELLDLPALPWLRSLVESYKLWTKIANGFGFELDEQLDGEPDDWNRPFFRIVPLCLVNATSEQVAAILSDHFSNIPERSFFDLLALFQRDVDWVYFNRKVLPIETAVAVRSQLIQMVRQTNDWRWLRDQRKERIDLHLAAAVSTLFFVESGGIVGTTKAYLLEKGIDGLGPFLPVLQDLVVDNPSPYVGNMALLLLEVSPRPEQMELLLFCAEAWMPVYQGNSQFWREYGFGQRWCSIVRKILERDSSGYGRGLPRRVSLDRVLAYLVTEGIVGAGQLEEMLKAIDLGTRQEQ
jgi:hypothetical protein